MPGTGAYGWMYPGSYYLDPSAAPPEEVFAFSPTTIVMLIYDDTPARLEADDGPVALDAADDAMPLVHAERVVQCIAEDGPVTLLTA